MSLQVLVPLHSSIPRPYTSTAHLPTPFTHRLVSSYNMSKYAENLEQQTATYINRRAGKQYPLNPPGESQWPSFMQVLVNLFQFLVNLSNEWAYTALILSFEALRLCNITPVKQFGNCYVWQNWNLRPSQWSCFSGWLFSDFDCLIRCVCYFHVKNICKMVLIFVWGCFCIRSRCAWCHLEQHFDGSREWCVSWYRGCAWLEHFDAHLKNPT